LFLLCLGSSARAFFQAVFLDGSILKGGAKTLLENLTVYLLDYPAYPASLALMGLCVAVGTRLVARRGSLHLGDELARSSPFRAWEVAFAVVLISGVFGGATYYLLKGPPGYPTDLIFPLDRLRLGAGLGLVAAAVVFVAHLVPTE